MPPRRDRRRGSGRDPCLPRPGVHGHQSRPRRPSSASRAIARNSASIAAWSHRASRTARARGGQEHAQELSALASEALRPPEWAVPTLRAGSRPRRGSRFAPTGPADGYLRQHGGQSDRCVQTGGTERMTCVRRRWRRDEKSAAPVPRATRRVRAPPWLARRRGARPRRRPSPRGTSAWRAAQSPTRRSRSMTVRRGAPSLDAPRSPGLVARGGPRGRPARAGGRPRSGTSRRRTRPLARRHRAGRRQPSRRRRD